MPELHDLLSDEADRQRPSSIRPFDELVRARRRRDRSTRVAGIGALGIVAVAGVALASTVIGPSGRSTVVRGESPSPTLGAGAATTAPCSVEHLDLDLRWDLRSDGSIFGALHARNTADRACLISGKPKVIPLSLDGTPAAVTQSQTLEYLSVTMLPQQMGTYIVRWDNWCGGETLSGKVQVYVNPGNPATDIGIASVTLTPKSDTLAGRPAPSHPGCAAGENSGSLLKVTWLHE